MTQDPALRIDSDNEYTLKEGQGSCWITVQNISVYIQRTDDGVAVDLWPLNLEHRDLSVTGTWLTFAEAEEDRVLENAKNIGA